MSLILDALRKMELERKAKRHGSPEIRAEVLNYRAKPQQPEKSWLVPVIVALLLLSSTTAIFLYVKSSGPLQTEAVRTTVPVPVVSPPQPDPLALPPGKTVPPAVVDKSAAASRPAALKDESMPPSGDNPIEVSGIAWQEERALRRAVINGALVGEGAEVSGAKVVEIRENLVRFNRSGRTFEVMYSSGAGR
jgi:general secretion pathway protein B